MKEDNCEDSLHATCFPHDAEQQTLVSLSQSMLNPFHDATSTDSLLPLYLGASEFIGAYQKYSPNNQRPAK